MASFRSKWLLVGGLFAIAILVWSAVFEEDNHGLLKVSFLDVGEGDSIFIQAPNGNQVLIDGGPNDKVLSALGKVMPFYDRSIDLVMASHPDADHITGLVSVLNRYKIGYEIEPGSVSASAVYSTLGDEVASTNVVHLIGRSGESVVLDKKKNIILSVLFPNQDASKWDTNDSSIVAKLSFGKTCFIFTGDSPTKIEDYLAGAVGAGLKCDVLKVGHHGSKTSNSPAFLAAVAPKFAVISVGKDNKYGLPNQETLDTINAFGSKILRTDELGTISFVSDGESVTKM